MECNQGRSCPYLGGGDIFALLKERQYLRQRISEMEVAVGFAEAEIRRLKEEKESLLHRVKKMIRKVFKPSVKRAEDGQGKRRGAPHGHPGKGRIRPEEIREWVDIYPNQCVCESTDIDGYEGSFDEHVENLIWGQVLQYHIQN